jgi:hypothetical protein
MNKPPSVELHIEELRLHGFTAGARAHIGEAVERELRRLFADQGVPAFFAHNIESAQLDAGAFNLVPGSKAEVIGVQVAQVIYEGLSR